MANATDYHNLNQFFITKLIYDGVFRNNYRLGIIDSYVINDPTYISSSVLTSGVYNITDAYTKETISISTLTVNIKSNYLTINASTNQLEMNSAYFNSIDFYYNTTGTLDLINVGSPYISPLNPTSVRQFVTNNITTFRFPTSYPYLDHVSLGRTQLSSLYVERRTNTRN